MLLRNYLEQGMSKAEVARELGVSRRTVHHWIETGQLDRELDDLPTRYGPRERKARKIDPYCEIIKSRLKIYPKLTATRLYEEIRAAGYQGGYSQVKVYVRQVRPRPEPEPPNRFETPPGRQGQVDFGEFKLPWGKRYALLVVLGYSRLLWVGFYERQTMDVLMRGLEAAFGFFGGVPSELLFDQMKAVVVSDRRAEGGGVLTNEEFRRFANHWNFRIRACRPHRAQTKGKVERPIRYMRQDFHYAREFVHDADLADQLEAWLWRANNRVHGTTGERPLECFLRDERGALKPLSDRPYQSLVVPASPIEPLRPSREVVVERRPLEEYGRLGRVSK